MTAKPPTSSLPLWKRILRCLSFRVTTEKGLDNEMAPSRPRTWSFEEQKDPGRTVVVVGGKIEF